MNNKEFIQRLAKKVKMRQQETQEMVSDVFAAMTKNFVDAEPVMIPNFGIFEIREKKARMIVNPESKLKMNIPAKSKLVFKPIIAMKEKVNKK